MNYNESTPRAEVTIQSLTFTLPQPYTAGHPLTEGEASQMNQLLSENVRNNFSGKIKSALEKGETPPDQAALDAYVAEYEFGVRRAGGGEARLTPVEREARRIARQRIDAALKSRNQKVEKEAMEGLVSQLAAKPEIIREAEKRMKAVEKVSLEELGIDLPAEQAAAA